jgi:tetratricopeptide (TPR) repeat protein/mono/diheme cytochrome c family protein
MTFVIGRVARFSGSQLIRTAGSCLVAALVVGAELDFAPRGAEASSAPTATQAEAVTFSRDIAPILFEHCVVCHRPGGVAPMSLLSYPEVRPWARAIAEQVGARRMPPWKPEPGYGGPFIGNRLLSEEQVVLIRQWVTDGAVEGSPADLPTIPVSPAEWRLGEPDLVIEMPRYTLPAGGKDVLRKFAIPIPSAATKYVRGVEFQPGNSRVVHHANMRIDPTSASRKLDAADPEPGYEGVTPFAARFPPGYFLGWTPGQLRPLAPDSMAWRLDAGADMLLELHLMPRDQPEVVQSRIGLFFGDATPTRLPATIRLGRQNLDIPAGTQDYRSRDSYVVPVDVEVYGVQPHAHYLAKEIKGFATLPDGTRTWLIYIRDWNFDWQDFYAYAQPFLLPKGTELTMEITYDNSAGNRRNPHSPPRRVTWGQQSSDEMGDLWIQVVPRHAADLQVLNNDRWPRELAEDIVGFEKVLASDPDQVMQHDEVALLYMEFGKVAEAAAHFRESARLQPESAAAQYNLGTTLLQLGDHETAIRHFEHALRLDPKYVRAHTNLGAALRLQGKPAEAIRHFREALLISPADGDALYNLAGALTVEGEFEEAITYYRRALDVQPDAPEAHAELAWLLATHPDSKIQDPSEAVRLAERASRLTNRNDAAVLDVLAAAYASAGRFDEAVATARAALALLPSQSERAPSIRHRLDLYTKRRPYQLPR